MATQSDLKKKMSEWAFASNQTLLSLPMDEEKRNFIRRENPGVVFSEVSYPFSKQGPTCLCKFR